MIIIVGKEDGSYRNAALRREQFAEIFDGFSIGSNDGGITKTAGLSVRCIS